ncbi:class I SAM-dependent methyltransferase [Polynucleobacter sp. AP-Feld-500C-C5]|uniref:class I SAM-dependent methyltransferase n=1 Tax=Polynucleobacter sp. AP-Feld-500C-C5 TaxID=2576924 RepID=UPI001C0E2592|nr:class I SAM-dependent methyltransferase [Polynucleobacter sp. AP-Feld-500C-C5]MBU3632875.1 class I SAM-dependent methyltransferase [Polynucleobacter sp. AP-Feld-500C-C5]
MNFKNKNYQSIYESPRLEMGMIAGFDYLNDPKHMLFTLSRYKFISKMLTGKNEVLEIGCGDGFYSPIIASVVGHLDAIDIDTTFIDNAKNKNPYKEKINFLNANILNEKPVKEYSAVFAVDLFEKIDPKNADQFMSYINRSLADSGVCILGIPSLESQKYASKLSKDGHINCLSGDSFKEFLLGYYQNVFMFSMNDEVVHTGYFPMAHYLIAVCVTKINGACNERI